MKTNEEKTCLCALGKIFGFEPKTGTALVNHLGSASEVFKLGKSELEELLGPHSRYTSLIRKSAVYDAADELEMLSRQGIGFVGWGEDEYPRLLAECPDAPLGLYIRSSTPYSQLWETEGSVSIVGTRDISSYGKEWCGRIVNALAETEERPAIVSGLALGTDICAHKAAVEAGLPTIAVMATGADSIYPYRHRDFADRICSIPGCALVTDYPPGTPPLPIHFLRRNRIIAGLSNATILVESKIKGGGMMTARLAFSYDRDLYALPGRVDDLRSQGCNSLIHSRMAEAIYSVPELIESIGLKSLKDTGSEDPLKALDSTYGDSVSPDRISQMATILTLIKNRRNITVEELAEETSLSYSRTRDLTSLLEIDGFICIDLLQRCCINVRKNR